MEPSTTPARPWMHTALIALGCFLAIFGAKVAYVHAFGSDLPVWDQWDAESERLLLPYEQGRLRAANFFTPHNEHRIAATKLFALGLFVANGQWDARLECVANAALHAAVAVIILLFGLRRITPRWQVAWLLAVLACIAAPMSWQNVVGGFHTQQTFLLGLSLGAIGLVLASPQFTTRWWLGLGCALVALFTMASGVLASATIVGCLLVLTPWRDLARRHAITLGVCLAIAALGAALHTPVSYHDSLKAASTGEFIQSFWRSLQWPAVNMVLHPVLGWMPWAWLTWRVWRQRGESDPGERVTVAAGVWVLAQYGASAYARGAGGGWPADRYLDTVAIGLLVNVLALLIALSRVGLAGWRRHARTAAAVVGAGSILHGWVGHISTAIHTTGPYIAEESADREASTRVYVRTGDPAALEERRIAHPNAGFLRQQLDTAEVRNILPASVRESLPLAGMSAPSGAFVADAVAPEREPPRGWAIVGSYSSSGDATEGEWRSDLIQPDRHRYWLIPYIASYQDTSRLSLRVVDADDRTLATILPGAGRPVVASSWMYAVVPAPRVPARLVAHDLAGDGWLAFGAPAGMAAGSWWAWRIAGHGIPIFWIGLVLGTTVAGGLLSRNRAAVHWLCREYERVRAMPRARMWAGALGCGLAAGLATFLHTQRLEPAYFEARVSGDLHKRSMELFFDRGKGIRGEDSAQVWFEEHETVRNLRLPLPLGVLRALRVDPMDHGATLTIENARIVDVNGRILRELPPEAFHARSQIASLTIEGRRLIVSSEPGALDSQLAIPLDPPLSTHPLDGHTWLRLLATLGATLAGLIFGAGLLDRTIRVAIRAPGAVRDVSSAWRHGTWRPALGASLRTAATRHMLAAVVLACGLLLFVRKADSFTNPQLWADDGSEFFLAAGHHSAASLFQPYNGYLHLLPRLGALLGTGVDPALLPAVYVWFSAITAIVCAIHLLSPRVDLPVKPLLILLVFAVPHTGEVYLNLANTQWFAGLLLLQLALKRDWTTPQQGAADLAMAVLCGLSGPFCILLLPVFAWRVWIHRTSPSASMLLAVLACACVQVATMAQAPTTIASTPADPFDLAGLLGVAGRRTVFAWLTASHIPAGDSRWFVGAISVVLAGALFLWGMRRDPWRPARIVLWASCILLLAASWHRVRFDLWDLADTANGDRYFFLPRILLGWLVVIEAAAATRGAWAARGILALMLAINAPAFRFAPLPDHDWRTHCGAIRRGEKADIPITPSGWILRYPGRAR